MKKVITYGTFDLFHEGHYNLLKRAKALGDYLIVGITTEQYDESRGKLNVVDSLLDRIENVKNSGFADQIIIEDHAGQKAEDIQKYGVDIFTVGSDWVGKFDNLKSLCEVVYLERTKEISSTLLRDKKYSILRLGIVGTGRIATRFVPEAKYVSGIITTGVYNPHIESAEKFGKKFDLDLYTDDWDKFIENIDAVYVASPHQTHYEYAKKALLAGKHVLCEKPMALKKEYAEELYRISEEKNCLLLEAVKTAYCPGFKQMIGVARGGVIGEICDIESCFTRITNVKGRERNDIRFGGAFLEYGNHTMLPIFKLMGTDYKSVQFDSVLDKNGVDMYTKAHFSFENGMALSKTGVGVKSEGQLVIAGTQGYILAPSPWWLTQSFEVRFEDPNKKETYSAKFLGDGLRYELSEFVSLIHNGAIRSFKFTAEESIAMASVIEKFLAIRE
ncbi:MAG: Gfo/Idh/MocA family oxidoreductase, partial [Clostridiales bacterium]|nr:Gfo/Idh/MocA family oxidoreductase [Clostridiales bacterium]